VIFPARGNEVSATQAALVRLDPKAVSLVFRCANLFFFYQSDDPFGQLQMHDYGIYQYEEFENYMDFKEEQEEKTENVRKSDLFKEHPYLKPIFRTRSSFLLYDILSKVSQTLIEV
jgi:hypothetical protein